MLSHRLGSPRPWRHKWLLCSYPPPTLNYCLYLISSLSTKLLSASNFPPHLHVLTLARSVCVCLTSARVLEHSRCVIIIGSTFCCPYVYAHWKQADCHCLYLLAFNDIYDNSNHFSSLFTSTFACFWLILSCSRSDRRPCS